MATAPRTGDRAAVSVVIPTIGRPALLRACLRSLSRCVPSPAEVIVVDQSADEATAAAVAEFRSLGARHVPDTGSGASCALNIGLRAARQPLTLITNDDCTVAEDWVGEAVVRARLHPGAIITGRVLPGGDDPSGVPSTKTDPSPKDYTGQRVINALYGGNMAAPTEALLTFGAFDERPGMRLAAEDNDLCYRWLRAGRVLRYEPSMTVWHHDWRSPRELARRYVEYARGDGALYAKHLLRGDLAIVPFALRELSWGLRGLAGAIRRRRFDPADTRLGILRGLPIGFVLGIRDEVRWRLRHRAETRRPT